MLRRLLTPLWLAFTALVVVVVVAFCALGWWQWQRYEAAGGSWQNLTYAVQWPIFAAFAGYLWWRMLKETGEPVPQHDAVEVRDELIEALQARRRESALVLHRTPEGDARADGDRELGAYNRYLAALHDRPSS